MTVLSDSWRVALSSWLTHLRLMNRSIETVRLRDKQLSRLAEAFPLGPESVSRTDLRTWLALHDWAAETLRSMVAGVAGFYRWAMDEGLVDRSPAVGLHVSRDHPLPHPIPHDVAFHAFAEASDDRIRLMLALGYLMGLRRSELAVVRGDDVVERGSHRVLLVHGKGARERALPMWPELADAVVSRGPGWVFPGQVSGHLSAHWVGRLIAEALPGNWTAHSLRHGFATRMWQSTHDLLLVQAWMGHTNCTTTQVYIQVAGDDLVRGLEARRVSESGWLYALGSVSRSWSGSF